jgi:hypothetical protein
MTVRPLWQNACGSLARVIQVPSDAELWYDDRDIDALKEDQKDAAQIRQQDATTAKTLVDAGYDPDSVQAAIVSDDFSQLKHTGLVSVQLQPPGTQEPEPEAPAEPAPEVNGANSRRELADVVRRLLPATTEE